MYCHVFYPEDGSTKLIRNICAHAPGYTVSQTVKQQPEFSALWKLESYALVL
jgi:hypothetical protein